MFRNAKRQIDVTDPRAKFSVRNEALPSAPGMAEVVAAVDGVNKAFSAFKTQNDAALAELKKGRDDVVSREHVDRINASVTQQESDLKALQAKIAAFAVSGGDGDAKTPEKKAHAKAFNGMLRKGSDGGLRDLEVKAALSTDSDPDGGFVVPEEVDDTISRVLETVSVMRRIATVRPMSAGTLKAVHNHGAATSGWVGETGARPETNTPKLSEVSYPAMELYAMPAATQSMLDDARINTEMWLADEVKIAFAEQEGAAFVNGDGVNKPRGFLNYPTVANASYVWGKLGYVATGAAGAFPASTAAVNAYDKLVDLYHAVRPGYRPESAFVMNDKTLAEIRKIKATVGDYIYLPPSATEPGSILGKVVETDDNMPDIAANAFAIAFGNFKRAYIIGDRVGVRVLRDPYSAKPYVLFYTTKRVAGGIRDFASVKLLKFAAS